VDLVGGLTKVREFLHQLRRTDRACAILVDQAITALLEEGSAFGRPLADRIKGSTLRVPALHGTTEIGILFIFDADRNSVLLVACNKAVCCQPRVPPIAVHRGRQRKMTLRGLGVAYLREAHGKIAVNASGPVSPARRATGTRRSRQSISQLVRGERGPGGFPAPVARCGARQTRDEIQPIPRPAKETGEL
jgi:hypothetical protein